MSLVELVDDLLTLEALAAQENDPDRRRSLDAVRSHLADRDRGAKVSEAAKVLGLSQPTVRAWIESGILEPIPAATPVRISVLSLADVKRALDLIRRHKDDRQLLMQVMRLLRDRAALAAANEGLADLAAGRVVPLTDELLDELKATKRGKQRSRSS
jgi:DNA-binding transcriptional MerR regulator